MALLAESQALRQASTRDLLIDFLYREFGDRLQIREHAVPRALVTELVFRCDGLPGALRSIAEYLLMVDPGSAETTSVLRLVDEWDAVSLFAGHDIAELRAALAPVGDHDLLRHATPDLSTPLPAYCESAWDVFAYLCGFNGAAGSLSCLTFLERLSDQLPAPQARTLDGFVASVATDWGTAAAGSRRIPEQRADARPEQSVASLLIQFEPHGARPGRFIMSHWYQWRSTSWQPVRGDDVEVDRGDLETAVEQVVYHMEVRWSRLNGPVMIEFILPWELLNEPVETWRKELRSPAPTELAMDYEIAIRSFDRLRSPEWHRQWHMRWSRLFRAPDQVEVYHSEPDGQPDYHLRLEARLKLRPGAVALVLSEPPVPNSLGQREMLAALRSGLPVVLWHRRQPADKQLRNLLADLVRNSALIELPSRAKDLRQQALSELSIRDSEGHIGRHLSLIWDDADRLPTSAAPPVSFGSTEGMRADVR